MVRVVLLSDAYGRPGTRLTRRKKKPFVPTLWHDNILVEGARIVPPRLVIKQRFAKYAGPIKHLR